MKRRNTILVLAVLLACFLLLFSGCNDNSGDGLESGNTYSPSGALSTGNKVLVAYFSCTNTTKGVAETIRGQIQDCDIYQIAPAVAYTPADLNYNTDCRANREQNDSSSRPAIKGSIENMADYDVVFIGYPIWWGQAPRIISTFLESYDFSGKTVIPFCTSGSSGIGDSDTNLHSLAPNAQWVSGRRFPSRASQSDVADWIESLDL